MEQGGAAGDGGPLWVAHCCGRPRCPLRPPRAPHFAVLVAGQHATGEVESIAMLVCTWQGGAPPPGRQLSEWSAGAAAAVRRAAQAVAEAGRVAAALPLQLRPTMPRL